MPAARRDARGRFMSDRARANVTIVGMDELERQLQMLADLGVTGAMTALIGTDLTDPPYPYFLEYGTSRMPAYPAARPAFDETRDVALSTVADQLGQAIARGNRRPEDTIEPALLAGGWVIATRWAELARYRTGTYRRSIRPTVVEGLYE
jgi:hypothetical protein